MSQNNVIDYISSATGELLKAETAYNDEIGELNGQIETLQEENKTLEARLHDLIAEIDHLEEENKTLEAKLHDIEEELNQARAELNQGA